MAIAWQKVEIVNFHDAQGVSAIEHVHREQSVQGIVCAELCEDTLLLVFDHPLQDHTKALLKAHDEKKVQGERIWVGGAFFTFQNNEPRVGEGDNRLGPLDIAVMNKVLEILRNLGQEE